MRFNFIKKMDKDKKLIDRINRSILKVRKNKSELVKRISTDISDIKKMLKKRKEISNKDVKRINKTLDKIYANLGVFKKLDKK